MIADADDDCLLCTVISNLFGPVMIASPHIPNQWLLPYAVEDECQSPQFGSQFGSYDQQIWLVLCFIDPLSEQAQPGYSAYLSPIPA